MGLFEFDLSDGFPHGPPDREKFVVFGVGLLKDGEGGPERHGFAMTPAGPMLV